MRSIPIPITSVLYLFSMALLLLFCLSACEKDDICVDGDTPLLVIRFYDQTDTTVFKNVTGIRVIGIGNGSPVDTFSDRASLDSIGLPLRLETGTTEFIFIRNSEDDNGMEIGNRDTIQFTYFPTNSFVSRACGFVGRYEDLSSQLTADADNWIQNIEISSSLVQSIDSAHVKIFH